MTFDVSAIRRQFPIFTSDPSLVYLDSAATSQKPDNVLTAMTSYYERDNANPHRGLYPLATRATEAYEKARSTVAAFIGAGRPEEIVFTKNATEGINIVAKGWGKNMKKGDAVALSALEHHSNVVPWLQLKEERGIDVVWIECDSEGRLELDSLDSLLASGIVKLVAVTSQSNVLGIRPDIVAITARAHKASALVLVDAAQSVAHHETDIRSWNCDFLVFSGHKLYGPMGIGVLYGKEKLLANIPPYIGGGMMIQEVTDDGFTAADIPAKFEGGTPPVAEAVGLKTAIDWIGGFAWEDIERHEASLIALAMEELTAMDGVRIPGPQDPKERSGTIGFTVDGMHPHDVAELLGQRNICVRAGHHCTQPLHRHFDLSASVRLSVGIYNTEADIRAFASALQDIRKRFR